MHYSTTDTILSEARAKTLVLLGSCHTDEHLGAVLLMRAGQPQTCRNIHNFLTSVLKGTHTVRRLPLIDSPICFTSQKNVR